MKIINLIIAFIGALIFAPVLSAQADSDIHMLTLVVDEVNQIEAVGDDIVMSFGNPVTVGSNTLETVEDSIAVAWTTNSANNKKITLHASSGIDPEHFDIYAYLRADDDYLGFVQITGTTPQMLTNAINFNTLGYTDALNEGNAYLHYSVTAKTGFGVTGNGSLELQMTLTLTDL